MIKTTKIDKNDEISLTEETKKSDNIIKDPIYKEKPLKQVEIGHTSGYYMRNARYKPGVKPLKLKENQ